MESFFHSMKAEGVHGRTFPDQQRLDQHVNRYMPFYNGQRIPSALGYVSPIVFEEGISKVVLRLHRSGRPGNLA